MEYKLAAILIAYFLDLIFGDPQWYWHPVRIIGRLIGRLERKLNAVKDNKIFSGIVLVFLAVGLTMSCVWLALKLAKFIHPGFYYILLIAVIYFGLSIKSLAVEANNVYDALKNKNIQKAKDALSMIVGRDTQKLDEPQIMRGAVETVAESITDGIIAPLFFLFLGGPVLMWGYKAVNTLDSMVGYRNEKFIRFGKAAALLDGWANFIPAKITCFFISIASLCSKKDWFNSAKWAFRYLLKGQVFNSVSVEAAMAGALRIRLGGLNYYNSIPVEKPFIGDNIYPLSIKHIKESIGISYFCSALALLSGAYLVSIIKKF